MACWQCEAPLGEPEPICIVCGVVQPPTALDPFARLGFARTAALTAADIGARRLELLLRLHPDRFAAHSPVAGVHALGLATAINDAARALRDPLDRVRLLLHLLGIEDEPGPPSPAFRCLLNEYEAAVEELAGVDAHAERDQLAREVAHRFQAAYDAQAALLEGLDPAEVLPGAALLDGLGQLRALRGLLNRLEALDTTPDRLGRRRT